MKYKKILFIAVVLYFLYILLKPITGDLLLKYYGKCIKAELIEEKIRVRYHKAELKYRFFLKGENYEGNSLETDMGKVGDNVCILFYEKIPSINRPLKYFNNTTRKCICD